MPLGSPKLTCGWYIMDGRLCDVLDKCDGIWWCMVDTMLASSYVACTLSVLGCIVGVM